MSHIWPLPENVPLNEPPSSVISVTVIGHDPPGAAAHGPTVLVSDPVFPPADADTTTVAEADGLAGV